MRGGGGSGGRLIFWSAVQCKPNYCNPLQEWSRGLSSLQWAVVSTRSPARDASWVKLTDTLQWWDSNSHVGSLTREGCWLETPPKVGAGKLSNLGTGDPVSHLPGSLGVVTTGRARQSFLEVRSWTRLLEKGQLSDACRALQLLVQQGCQPSTYMFYVLLTGCVKNRNLAVGRDVHSLALRCGYESNSLLATHIIRMYASHGSLPEASQVFSKLAAPNNFAWASIILAHAEHGQPEQAIRLYARMRQSTPKPDSYVFVAVLKACACSSDLSSGRQVHSDIVKSSVEPNLFVENTLLDMYSKCGSLEDARRVFDNMQNKSVVTWTAMIAAYAQRGLGHKALDLYSSMQKDGVNLADSVTFVCLLKACASLGAIHEGKQLHVHIREKGLETHWAVGNSLVDMYAKCGSLEDARGIFDNLQRRDVVSWNTMIAGYAQLGLGAEALKLYAGMLKEGISLADQVTFVCLLRACSSTGAIHEGKQLHSQIQQQGLELDLVVGNSLIDMFMKCGSLEDALSVFERLPTKDVVTWTSMIAGYTHHGLAQEALSLCARMQKEGLTPANHVTYVCLLKACASVGALREGQELHSKVLERGLEAEVVVGNSLVDMYAKCGRLEDAHNVFDRLPTRNVVTWNALLNGYGQHNDCGMAVHCFAKMQECEVEPDATTFISLLVACSHEGLVKEGQEYFESMVEDHGIKPTVEHYACLVDLLGRAGHLDEAEILVRSMPLEDDGVVWTSLLSACSSHGDIARASRCFDRIIAIRPQQASAYALMSSIYADAGQWGHVESVERLRKSTGAQKKPARAWIEVNSKVHSFDVGEDRDDTSRKLRSINLQKEGGFVPHTELVLKPVSDKEKEDNLCGHAEKLALAYGLLNTPEGTSLVVTKNLRMCNDCHSGTKLLSRIEKREITVRDAHRVHHFRDGFCSCGDSI